MAARLPPLNALKAFEVAGRHESFSQAAKELGVSHSAISRHVRGLEHQLGVALFRDLPRGVELTAAGRVYLAKASAGLELIAQATEELAGPVRGRIVVNCEPRFARSVLVPLMSEFHARHPEVDVRLESSRTLVDVEHYEADIALRFANRGQLDVPSDLVSNLPMYVYAAPSLRPEGWGEVSQLLEYRRFRDRNADVWRLWAEGQGLDGALWSLTGWRMQAELAYEAALCGQGVYLGGSDCAQRDVAAGRLVRCFDHALYDGAICLIMGSQAERKKAARLFRAWLLKATQELRVDVA